MFTRIANYLRARRTKRLINAVIEKEWAQHRDVILDSPSAYILGWDGERTYVEKPQTHIEMGGKQIRTRPETWTATEHEDWPEVIGD